MVDAMNTAATGLQTYGTWLEVTANNIANANNTARSNAQMYRAESLLTRSQGAGANGVGQGLAATVRSGSNGVLTQDPNNPIADSLGYVRRADVDLSQQMGDLVLAQRRVEANATTIKRARAAFEAVIAMGRP